MRRRTLDALIAKRAAGEPVALVTELTTGLECLVTPNTVDGSLGLYEEQLATARRMLRDDRSGVMDETLFVHVTAPPPRLIIVGAVHIAQALATMATQTGYAVTIIDPRQAFATEARFPGVRLIDAWPDDAVTDLKLDSRAALVTLTHDPKLDDPALEAGLRSDAFFIGSLGSRKTHAARLARLTAKGFSAEALARIHGPVGLDIGAVTQAEIAISILAQITAIRRSDQA